MLPTLDALEPRALFSGGQLDATFNTTGISSLSYKDRATETVDARHVLATPDGRNYVVALTSSRTRSGSEFNDTYALDIVRVAANGRPDATFATATGNHLTLADVPDVGGGGPYSDALLDSAGRLIVQVEHNVYRYDADGHLDTTFGRKGVYRLVDVGNQAHIAVAGDGSIYIATTRATKVSHRTVYQGLLTHLSAKGRLDTAFADDGTFEMPQVTPKNSSNYSTAVTALRVLDDGSLMAAGTAAYTLTNVTTGNVPDRVVTEAVKLTPAGKLVTGYGDKGVKVRNSSDIDYYVSALPAAIRGDGALLVVDGMSRDYDVKTNNYLIAPDGQSEKEVDVNPLSTSGVSSGTFITEASGTSLFVGGGTVQRLKGNGNRDKAFNNGRPLGGAAVAALQYDGTIVTAYTNYVAGRFVSVSRVFRDDAPVASLAAPTQRHSGTYKFSVTFRAPYPIDADSIDGNELRIIAPDGTTYRPKLTSTSKDPYDYILTAAYRFGPPNGKAFRADDNGVYTVRTTGQAATTTRAVIAKRTIGTFTVKIA